MFLLLWRGFVAKRTLLSAIIGSLTVVSHLFPALRPLQAFTANAYHPFY